MKVAPLGFWFANDNLASILSIVLDADSLIFPENCDTLLALIPSSAANPSLSLGFCRHTEFIT
jgi:hypothetical protein